MLNFDFGDGISEIETEGLILWVVEFECNEIEYILRLRFICVENWDASEMDDGGVERVGYWELLCVMVETVGRVGICFVGV